MDYFQSLDKDGGFFYERWGDAPIHSIAAALLLQKDEIHFFNDIAYYHVPFTHCPTGAQYRLDHKCHCNPKENFDWQGYSCMLHRIWSNSRASLLILLSLGTSRWFEANNKKKPEGYEKEQS
jgi:alpha 1,2-mannosyltransferase